jgi:hypothetical protein
MESKSKKTSIGLLVYCLSVIYESKLSTLLQPIKNLVTFRCQVFLSLSAFLNEVRTYFEKKFCMRAEKSYTKKEFSNLLFQVGRSSWGGRRTPPIAFTEQGVAMLSGVLHSERAIKVNIQIMRVFTRMRELLETHKEIMKKLDDLERKDIEQDKKIILIFEYLKKLELAKRKELDQQNPQRVGFKRKDEN